MKHFLWFSCKNRSNSVFDILSVDKLFEDRLITVTSCRQREGDSMAASFKGPKFCFRQFNSIRHWPLHLPSHDRVQISFTSCCLFLLFRDSFRSEQPTIVRRNISSPSSLCSYDILWHSFPFFRSRFFTAKWMWGCYVFWWQFLQPWHFLRLYYEIYGLTHWDHLSYTYTRMCLCAINVYDKPQLSPLLF